MKREIRILIITAIVLVSLSVGLHLIFGGKKDASWNSTNKNSITKEANKQMAKDSAKNVYSETYDRIYKLNIGNKFTKDSLLTYIVDNEFCAIWVDIKTLSNDYCMYEIKGADEPNSGVKWRYYIRTEKNKIVSIVKGQ